MRIERLNFREFDAGMAARPTPAGKPGMQPLLPGGRRREGAPPPPPSFSEEQLKAAERDAYKKGFLEGTEEGRKQAESEQALIERQLSETVEKFAAGIAPLVGDYRQMIVQLKQDAPKVALAIARKVAGNALSENAAAAVEDVAMRCVESMIAEPKISITVHESLAEALEKKLKALAERLQATGDIIVLRDKDIAPADCRIEWKYGAMERHTGQLWECIEKAVASMAAGAEHEASRHMEKLETQLSSTTESKE